MDALSAQSRIRRVRSATDDTSSQISLVVLKGGHTWRFRFEASCVEELVDTLIDLSANPGHGLDPFEMLTLAWDVAREVRKQPRGRTASMFVANL